MRHRSRMSSPARALAYAQRLREDAEAMWAHDRDQARGFLLAARLDRRRRLAEAREAERHARSLVRLRDGLPLRQSVAPPVEAPAPPPAPEVAPARKPRGRKRKR